MYLHIALQCANRVTMASVLTFIRKKICNSVFLFLDEKQEAQNVNKSGRLGGAVG